MVHHGPLVACTCTDIAPPEGRCASFCALVSKFDVGVCDVLGFNLSISSFIMEESREDLFTRCLFGRRSAAELLMLQHLSVGDKLRFRSVCKGARASVATCKQEAADINIRVYPDGVLKFRACFPEAREVAVVDDTAKLRHKARFRHGDVLALRGIQRLRLDGVRLAHENLPEGLAPLAPSLLSLTLQEMHLSGMPADTLGRLTGLKTLVLDGVTKEDEDEPLELGELKGSLEHLEQDLCIAPVTPCDNVFFTARQVGQLTALRTYRGPFEVGEGEEDEEPARLPSSLRELQISHLDFPALSLSSLPHLESLRIEEAHGLTPAMARGCPQSLRHVSMPGEESFEDEEHGVAALLAHMPCLTSLHITSCSEAVFVSLAHMTRLAKLIISPRQTELEEDWLRYLPKTVTDLTITVEGYITGAGFAHMSQLQRLSLQALLSFDGAEMPVMPSLTYLEVDQTPVDDAVLARMPKLRTLVLHSPCIFSNINASPSLAGLAGCPSLREVVLEDSTDALDGLWGWLNEDISTQEPPSTLYRLAFSVGNDDNQLFLARLARAPGCWRTQRAAAEGSDGQAKAVGHPMTSPARPPNSLSCDWSVSLSAVEDRDETRVVVHRPGCRDGVPPEFE